MKSLVEMGGGGGGKVELNNGYKKAFNSAM